MIINSNDIFSQIGLAVDPQNKNNFVSKAKYTICLEIQLSQQEKHILEVKDNDNPRTIAIDFCQKHRLNKLAVNIVEAKIRQAKQIEQEKYKKSITNTKAYNTKNMKNQNKLQKSRKKTSNAKGESPIKQTTTRRAKNEKNQSITPNKSVSKSKSKSKLESTSDNIYLRSLVKTRLIEQQRNKMKVEMDKKQQQQLTFKPKINNVSQKIVEFLKTNNAPKQRKPSSPKKMYEEMAQCTFKPKINKVSQRIINNRSALKQQRDQHNNLYNQGKQKPSSKKAVEDERYSFKPQINPKSAQKITIPFFKRLEITEQRRNKQANKQTFNEQQECSFQPKIGRPPAKSRNKQNLSIWEHLHYGSKKDENNYPTDVGVSQISKETKASQQYYENLIQERISDVFATLDDNKDGLISPNQIAIELLPMQSLQFLKPIFMQMDQVDATLNYYQFKKAVHALMADSDPGSKGAFIAAKWKKQITQQQIFKPNINKRSKQLSAHRSVQNLYKDGLKQKQNRQYKLEKERALKQQKQLAQCSFKPSLNRSSKVYIDKITKKKTQTKPNKNLSEMIHSFMKQNDDKQ